MTRPAMSTPIDDANAESTQPTHNALSESTNM
jgi:hypothetical protein